MIARHPLYIYIHRRPGRVSAATKDLHTLPTPNPSRSASTWGIRPRPLPSPSPPPETCHDDRMT